MSALQNYYQKQIDEFFRPNYSLLAMEDADLCALAVKNQDGITASYIENPSIRQAAFAHIYY